MERNYGIDFFRITSMFMVVILHVIGQGGILSTVAKYSAEYWIACFFEIACYCAVNCFALISGYVMHKSSARFSKALELWFQTIFYTVLSLIVIGIIFPASVNSDSILDAILPVTRGHYWYISAYFGMYILSPLLNVAINHIEKKVFLPIIIAILLLVSVLPSFLGTDPYKMQGGYSMIWLCLLYIVGAFISKYKVAKKIKISQTWGIVVGALCFTFLSKFIPEHASYTFFKVETRSNFLISYTSPTIVLIAVALLVIFSRLTLNKTTVRIIKIFAPASLGVYLIHVNKQVWEYVIKDFAKPFADGLIIIPFIFLSAVAIYIICSIAELGRIGLFRVLKVKKLCIAAEEKTKKIFDKISDKF